MNSIENESNNDHEPTRGIRPGLRTATAFCAATLLGAIATYRAGDPGVGATVFAATLGALTRR